MSMHKFLAALMGCFFLLGLPLAHADQAPVKKKWTFMVFLNGNNNLDNKTNRFGEKNIKAMEQVGSNDDVNIVVQWASLTTHKVTRLYIQKSTNPDKVTSPVIEDLGSVDMGNPESLENFVAWTVEHYPAEHYFIDVWNHGGGWQKKRLAGASRDISWDDLTGNSITTEQLGHVMARAAFLIGHKVDIYGSDACLMGMIEVANEMSDSVQYFIGSQETEPMEGWPYAQLLAKWEATKDATSNEIVNILTQEFVKAYQPGGVYPENYVTMSAYDLSKLPALNKTLYALGETMRQLPPGARARVLALVNEVQKFDFPDYADLIDFMTILSSANLKGLHVEEMDKVIAAANAMIIANKTTAGYEHANGLSIWLPKDKNVTYPNDEFTYKQKAERYKHLRFSLNTKWNQTLESLLQGVNQQQGLEQSQLAIT